MDKMLAMERAPASATASLDRFEALFAAQYPRVVAIAQRVLLDSHLAEDVAQDVFTSLLRSSKSIDPNHATRWLHAAAVHTALNLIRGNRRRAAREERDARARFVYDPPDDTSDPHEMLEGREQRALVRAALQRLSPKYAAILALRYAGLSYAEIAAAINIGINQVGTTLARAESAFKKEISSVSS